MVEFVRQGQTVRIRPPLWDGAQMLTGKTVVVSIERQSDGFFWDGAAFPDGDYRTVAMTELAGNVHVEGVYEYVFLTPSAIAVYDWSVKYVAGSLTTYFKGRIIVNDVDVGLVRNDSNSAVNLKNMYNGTGYVNENGPASRAQVAGLSTQTSVDTLLARLTAARAAALDLLSSIFGFTLETNNDVTNMSAVIAPTNDLVDVSGNPSFTLFATTGRADNFCKGQIVTVKSGPIAGETSRVQSFVGATRLVTVDPPFTAEPGNFSAVVISPVALFHPPANFRDLAITPDDGFVTAVGGGGPNITVGAIQATADAGNRTAPPIKLEVFVTETKVFSFTVLDANGDPVDLEPKTLRFVVHDENTPTASQFKVDEGTELTVSGDDNEVANVKVLESQVTAAIAGWLWELWDIDADEVLAHGHFEIQTAKKDHP